MEEVKDLRKAVIEYIQTADEKVVKMVHAMLEVDAEDELWDQMPNDVKADVEAALQESERGEGMNHDEVMKKYSNGLQDNCLRGIIC
jgi:predicted transcriptional regulator